MKNHKILFSIILLLSLFSLRETEALQFKGKTPRLNNQRFLLDQEVSVPLSITVSHKGLGLDYFITFSAGASPTSRGRYLLEPSGAAMYYNIFDDGLNRNILLALQDSPGNGNVLSGSFTDAEASSGGGATRDHSFTVILDPNQFPLAGSYSDSVTISLYEGTITNTVPGGPVDTVTFSLSSRMDTISELSLVPEGASFDPLSQVVSLDFGLLRPGSYRAADLLVRSNSLYSVSLQSANGGVMVIQDPTDNSIVPYTLDSNGITISLNQGADSLLAGGAAATDETGDRYTIGITINDYGMATEGFYTDTLTFTLTAP